MGVEEEEQKGEERSGRQGRGGGGGKNNICEGSSEQDRVTVRLCGGASRECIGGCGTQWEGRMREGEADSQVS